ncbi:MAG: DUF2279 domain-containing protein [Deltaproteobacteria bacterium]|nr:DUF2279 domain-containing protein [Deltaproteobacteria bacterium]
MGHILFGILLFTQSTGTFSELSNVEKTSQSKTVLSENPVYSTAAIFAGVPLFATLVGMQLWEWGDTTHFKANSDGWFSSNTTHGGADKMGHMMSFYSATKVLSWYFDKVFPGENVKSSFLGALLASIGGICVEIGDGFATNYGFSYTDLVANSAGVLIALGQRLFPGFDDLVDLSMFYFPSPGFFTKLNENKTDVVTDYSGQLTTISLRLGGISWIKETPLRFIRFDVGYFTRCYQPYDNCSKERSGVSDFETRNIYYGVSFDFARMIQEKSSKNTFDRFLSRALRLYNINGFFPIGINTDLNSGGSVSQGISVRSVVSP